MHFFLREPSQKSSSAQKGAMVLNCIKKALKSHLPSLLCKFETLPDHRKRRSYSMKDIIGASCFMFLLKESSRNAYNNDWQDDNLRSTIFKHFNICLPGADAIDHVLCNLPSNELEAVKMQIVSDLFERKTFRSSRLQSKYYTIAVDGTGMASFDHRHCEHCLTKTSKNGVVTYFHYVLEAKLVTTSGYCISLASEFIENKSGRDYQKQDCEQKAFVRLATKIKKHYPRLPICILADGLYPNNTVFDICRRYGWKFIITLKDGCLKTFQTEVDLLKSTSTKRTVYCADKTTRTTLEYSFLNDIEYSNETYSWVSCIQNVVNKKDNTTDATNFVYITNIRQDVENVISTADNGRLRWKIENEGFNTQKNLGYALEHKYSRTSYTAMQNYYQLLQIAHIINQFAEKSSNIIDLKKQYSKQTIRALWKDFISYLKFYTEQYISVNICNTE